MIYVTGSNGQLGYEICRLLSSLNIDHVGLTREDFNLINRNSIIDFFKNRDIGTIIHSAAYTNVDQAEVDRELCKKVNYDGTRYLLDICKVKGGRFIYISTDYVFDGDKDSPYEVYDSVNPINYYGYTKALSEEYVIREYLNSFIIRVSSIYGSNGRNFLKSIIDISSRRGSVDVVGDQIISPSYSKHLALGIINIMNSSKNGIYHLTNNGVSSIYDFILLAFKLMNIRAFINRISLKDYKSLAKRGRNMILSNRRLLEEGIDMLPSISEGLLEFIEEMGYTN